MDAPRPAVVPPVGPAAGARARRVRRRRRTLAALLTVAVAVVLVAVLLPRTSGADVFPAPSPAALRGLNVRERVVAIASSQVGYHSEPSLSYCNKFSAYWHAGMSGCPGGERSEEWCADFAAWAWRLAGARFTYGYAPGEIDGAAASFYVWGVAHGRWHPAAGYVAAPGDVAIYGLRSGAVPTATHVAIVTSDAAGQRGPDVVNGDGDRTGFSVVETGTDQLVADAGHRTSTLAGYVAPP